MVKKKVKIGIIGTGNLGSDLLMKALKSEYLEVGMFAGQNPESENIARAKKLGVPTSHLSIQAIENNPECCDIVFDATTADAHVIHAPILKKLKKFTIDLTPSRIGKMCVPMINIDECLAELNINMITCGGQATIPLIKTLMEIEPQTEYAEIVGSISSKSAGIGTRNNIDEYTQTTSEGIKSFTHVPRAKAIIILNPADPPIIMHNMVYAQIKKANLDKLTKEMEKTVKKIKQYVPGYKLTVAPLYDNGIITMISEVVGRGDYLPAYAGNLDIINCAAIAAAEAYAKRK